VGPSDFGCSEPEEYVSLTRFAGSQEEVVLRAIWSESPHQLLMRKAQIVERKALAARIDCARREGPTSEAMPTRNDDLTRKGHKPQQTKEAKLTIPVSTRDEAISLFQKAARNTPKEKTPRGR
jgi:hypothetical protein